MEVEESQIVQLAPQSQSDDNVQPEPQRQRDVIVQPERPGWLGNYQHNIHDIQLNSRNEETFIIYS